MSSRTRLVALAPALVILALWAALVWRPRTSAESSARAATEQAQTELAQVDAQLAVARKAAADPAATAAAVAAAQAAVPATDDLGNHLVVLGETAAAAGVQLVGTTPKKVTTIGPAATKLIDIAISVRGEPAAILDYVHRIEQLPRTVTVQQMTFTREGGGAASAELDTRIYSAA